MTEGTRDERRVFADERQARIAEHVAVRGRAHIAELATMFGVTEVTIRKDLGVLQDRGLLKRTHGGAIARMPLVDRDLERRVAMHRDAKEAIGHACAGLLKAGDSVFLSGGSTVRAIAGALAAGPQQGLTVLTNSTEIALALAGTSGVDHLLVGGQIHRASGSLVGPIALHNLQRFTVDIAFVGASGFSELGVTVGNVEEAEILAAVIERARRVVLPLHDSKVGPTDFAKVCELDQIDVLVINRANLQIAAVCAANGIELVAAES
ncbi:MAG: DeoR family transcriptional regulator, fructose operon transcriptional repressor [Solirubrobacteraceae bacterium]|jgi:DeoR/GlpR family transcriptional regulator of sugar metabolism|nr:DeoR family transcriptional regulator, fructose operon transcriptional repressor [Solirubrobacteraceae bacterium]